LAFGVKVLSFVGNQGQILPQALRVTFTPRVG